MVNDKKFLPVRVVQPSRDFEQKDERQGGKIQYFIEEAEQKQHQDLLISEMNNIESNLIEDFKKYPGLPTVIKAKLRKKALAKSHRPTELFKRDTCPIIGLDNMGEVLISVTQSGIGRLKTRITSPTSERQKANITAVQEISNYKEIDKLMGLTVKKLIEKSKRNNHNCIKVILFDHQEQTLNENIKHSFLSWIQSNSLKADDISALNNLSIWRVPEIGESKIHELIKHPSVRTISFFPSYKLILQKDLVSSKEILDIPQPQKNKEYPTVAIIDTGISENHPSLSPWVIDKYSFVPMAYQNNNHGSFVAGLVCMGNKLNGTSICPDDEQIQIIDIQMIPDEKSSDTVTEDILIERLKECVPEIIKKHHVRIWNMSAAFNDCTGDEMFSSLAVFLDKLQEENNFILTLPSGNYTNIEQRKWPPQSDINNTDKLQVPADSVRAITVGAIACKENLDSVVKINEPASYSCRGPGPTYIPKPEIVHYSGNLTVKNGELNCFNQGILSFDDKGNISEGIGTSYSCPLAARTMALLHDKLADPISNNMIKAITIHNSYVPKNLGASEDVFPYVGFGKPEKVEDMLKCSASEVTIMFEQEIYEKTNLIIPFVWPKSLINADGKCRGKVRMTLVAGIPLDANFGSEYIRANIDASLHKGIIKNEEMVYNGVLGEEPTSKDLSKYYEIERIENGYKWKPIKRYEATFSRKKADDWRIKISLLLREGFKPREPIRFALIFTLSDPEGVAPVYDEVIIGLRNKNVITNPIQLRAQVQEKIRT